jgi:hypothetical protein
MLSSATRSHERWENTMSRTGRAALIAAALTSVISIADAVQQGATGRGLLDPATSPRWVMDGGAVLLAATFALLAAVLAGHAAAIDRGRRWIGAVRRLMQAVLAVLALNFAGGLWVDRHPGTTTYRAWEVVGGVSFLLMFLVGVVLGVSLLRRRDLRWAALLTAAPVVLFPLMFAVQALAPGWGHPAYAETALYLGLALLGREPTGVQRTSTRTSVPLTAG